MYSTFYNWKKYQLVVMCFTKNKRQTNKQPITINTLTTYCTSLWQLSSPCCWKFHFTENFLKNKNAKLHFLARQTMEVEWTDKPWTNHGGVCWYLNLSFLVFWASSVHVVCRWGHRFLCAHIWTLAGLWSCSM